MRPPPHPGWYLGKRFEAQRLLRDSHCFNRAIRTKKKAPDHGKRNQRTVVRFLRLIQKVPSLRPEGCPDEPCRIETDDCTKHMHYTGASGVRETLLKQRAIRPKQAGENRVAEARRHGGKQ